jgi:predicted secreted protein
MTTAANIGRWKAYLGSTGSPVSYTAIEEVFEISGVGQTNDLVDVTNFDSATGTREFIGGLADGQEITVRANYYPTATQQAAMVTAVGAKVNRAFRVSYVGVSPAKTWTFQVAPLSWVLEPSVDDKNVIAFTAKISGAITAA